MPSEEYFIRTMGILSWYSCRYRHRGLASDQAALPVELLGLGLGWSEFLWAKGEFHLWIRGWPNGRTSLQPLEIQPKSSLESNMRSQKRSCECEYLKINGLRGSSKKWVLGKNNRMFSVGKSLKEAQNHLRVKESILNI